MGDKKTLAFGKSIYDYYFKHVIENDCKLCHFSVWSERTRCFSAISFDAAMFRLRLGYGDHICIKREDLSLRMAFAFSAGSPRNIMGKNCQIAVITGSCYNSSDWMEKSLSLLFVSKQCSRKVKERIRHAVSGVRIGVSSLWSRNPSQEHCSQREETAHRRPNNILLALTSNYQTTTWLQAR